MKTTYVCPDCGQEMEHNLNDCPNCGSPATEFMVKNQPYSENVFNGEKIYYVDGAVKITNKLWSFCGDDDIKSVITHFPVDNISSVSLSRDNRFIFVLILGVFFFIAGIVLIACFPWAVWLLSIIVAAIALIIIAQKIKNKRQIVIKPFNGTVNFTYTLEDIDEAKRLLNPMLKCLIENR
jgi:DNA-directed RNA polymerase subunit RPC12/RpoP